MKKLLLIALLMLTLVFTAVACSSDDGTADTTGKPEVTKAPTESTAAPDETKAPNETKAPDDTATPGESNTAAPGESDTAAPGESDTAAPGEETTEPTETEPTGPVMWDVNKDVIGHLSFDELRKNGDGANGVFTAGHVDAWDGVATVDEDVTYIDFWGWVALMSDLGSFGYQIDDKAPVYSESFTVEAEDGVKTAAATIAKDSIGASRMLIGIDVSKLSGKHTVTALYKDAAGKEVALRTFTVVRDAPEQAADITESFTSDVASQEVGTALGSTDLKNYFTLNLPLAGSGVEALGEGKVYHMTSINEMFADMDGLYYVKVNNVASNANGWMFVRGYQVVNADSLIAGEDQSAGIFKINNFYETDGNGAMGGAGIYARISDGMLHIMVKYYDAEKVARVGNKLYSIACTGTELTVVDDGSVVSLLVDGKLLATITLTGSKTYDDMKEGNVLPYNTFAATATVKLADGTTETIENTLIADSYNCQVGVVARAGDFFFTSIEVGGASAITIPEMEDVTPVKEVPMYHANLDFINGATAFPVASKLNNVAAPVVNATEKGIAVNDKSVITFKGWMAVMGGINQYVYSVDGGKTWTNAPGGYDGEPLEDYYNKIGVAQGVDSKKNGMFNLTVDLSACAGKTVNLIIGAVPETDTEQVIVMLEIDGLAIPAAEEPEDPEKPEAPTREEYNIAGNSEAVDFVPAGYTGKVFQLMNYGKAILLGDIDLSQYSAIIVTYGSDGGAKLGDVGSKIVLTQNGAVSDGNNQDVEGVLIIGSATLTNATAGWAGGDREAVITLDTDYNGPVYICLKMGDGNGIAISSIVLVKKDASTDPEEPEDPEKPFESTTMNVTTTDTYGWFDSYSFTAPVDGTYTFTVPAGLGLCSADVWDAELDYNTNPDGGVVKKTLKAGETYEFLVGAFTKADWTITIALEAGSAGGEDPEEPIDPVEPEAPALTLGVNTITVTDAILAEGGVEGTFEVTEAGNYTFKSNDLLVRIYNEAGEMMGAGVVYLEPGSYTAKIVVYAWDAGDYTIEVTFTLPDTSESFTSDVASQEVGTALGSTDLKNYFTLNLPLAGSGVEARGEGKVYHMTSINEMYANMDGLYYVKVNNVASNPNGWMFVRGYQVVKADSLIEASNGTSIFNINNFYETDGNGVMGGAGIYARISDGKLHIMVKYYDAEKVARVGNKFYSIACTGTELTVVDDGSVVSLLVDGKLLATITLTGSKTYDDMKEGNVKPYNTFAATATVKLADGTTETIENTLIADSYKCQVGVVARAGDFFFTSIEVGGASAITIPEMEVVTPVKEVPMYHANLDLVNGAPAFGVASKLNGVDAPVVNATEKGIAVNNKGVITFQGWMAVKGGINQYVYSVDGGKTWTNAPGGSDGEPLENHYQNIGVAQGVDSKKNGMFLLTVDLSAYAGETVNLIIGAVPETDTEQVIVMFEIDGLVVPEPAPADPTRVEYDIASNSEASDFAAAGYTGKVFQLMNFGKTILLGDMDLSQYSAIIVTYGSDGGAKLGDAGSKIVLTKNGAVSNDQNQDVEGVEIIGSADLTNATAGWAGGDREAVIELNTDYNGPVYICHKMGDGNGIAVSSIVLVKK